MSRGERMADVRRAEPLELLNLEEQTHQVRSTVPLSVPLFEACPGIVEFREYEAFGRVEAVVRFRNNDYVARRIRIEEPADSTHFRVRGPHGPKQQPLKQSKIATGMEAWFTVVFTPDEVRDYACDLICVTEREKFALPVRAIGVVPKLSLPDEVNFGCDCVVKAAAVKPLLVQNVGDCVVAFTLETSGAPFAATPRRGRCARQKMMTVELEFLPRAAQSYRGELLVEMWNGSSRETPADVHAPRRVARSCARGSTCLCRRRRSRSSRRTSL